MQKKVLKQYTLFFQSWRSSLSVGQFLFGGKLWFSFSLLRLVSTFVMNSGLTARCSLLSAVALCRTALSISIKKLRIINWRTTTSVMNSGLTARCSLLSAVALCRTALSISIKKLRIINWRTTTSRTRKSCIVSILWRMFTGQKKQVLYFPLNRLNPYDLY